MILRKPYALLIKYFKVFHLVLTALIYLFSRYCKNVLAWFDEYIIIDRYNQVENLISTYLPYSVYFYIIAIIAICIVIIVILNVKKKPLKYYFVTIIYFIIEIVGLIFVSYELHNIEQGVVDVRMIRFARDITIIMYYSLLPFGLIALVRGVGFNVKQFNFKKDLAELAIESGDNEEVEVDVTVDVNDLKTKTKRILRKMKYFYLEHKAFVISFVTVILLSTAGLVYFYLFLANKIYKENETFLTNNFEITVVDSYQVTTDNLGTDLGKYVYDILKIKIKNKSTQNIKYPYINTKINVNETTGYKPITTMYNTFSEFGKGYNDEIINAGETVTYTFIFQIDEKYEKNSKQYQYLLSATSKNNEVIFKYAKVNLKPQVFTTKEKVSTTNFNEELIFSNGLIDGTKLTISDVSIADSFTYQIYQYIGNEKKTFNRYITPTPTQGFATTIMRLKLNIDVGSNSNLLSNKFITKYGVIRYINNDTEYVSNYVLKDVTPSTIKDYTYFEVKDSIKKADKIYLDFVIRNKVYTYILKEE